MAKQKISESAWKMNMNIIVGWICDENARR